MVTEYGFSDKLGRLRYADNEEEVFLGHSVARQKNVSDATAALIDEEVRRLIDEAEVTAYSILKKNRNELETVANALLEYETLSGDEVKGLLKGEAINRSDNEDPNSESGARSSVPTSGTVKKGNADPNANQILNDLKIAGADTFTLDTEKIVLEGGDRVIAVSQSPANLAMTISYLEV